MSLMMTALSPITSCECTAATSAAPCGVFGTVGQHRHAGACTSYRLVFILLAVQGSWCLCRLCWIDANSFLPLCCMRSQTLPQARGRTWCAFAADTCPLALFLQVQDCGQAARFRRRTVECLAATCHNQHQHAALDGQPIVLLVPKLHVHQGKHC